MKLLMALFMFLPAIGLAAPSGHQICHRKINGQGITFVFGTYAMAGDAAARSGERGLLAGDVIEELRACVNS